MTQKPTLGARRTLPPPASHAVKVRSGLKAGRIAVNHAVKVRSAAVG
jgi:hypothetical protein